MTCIVGVRDGEKLWLGGDSAASSPPTTEIYTVAAPKVFAVGEYLVGYTVSFRAGQVLQYQAEWPSLTSGADLLRVMVCDVVPELRRALREAGVLKVSEGVEQGAHFLIGIRGELFSVGLDFSVAAFPAPYMAIGSGRNHAYGALHALSDFELAPEARVQRALEAAACFTHNVRPPFAIISSCGSAAGGSRVGGVPAIPM